MCNNQISSLESRWTNLHLRVSKVIPDYQPTKPTCPEDVPAAVAPGGELRVVAWPAVDTVGLGAKLLVHEGGAALGAHEACLVPVLLLVGKILGVNPNDLATLITGVGEDVLVTFDAVRMVISQDIPGQGGTLQ